MKLVEALKSLYEGNSIALPEWKGWWFLKEGKVCVHHRDGSETFTPYFDQYGNREDWEVVNIPKNQELGRTATQMLSPDYKERFKAEYIQLKNRHDSLKKMCERWDVNQLDFTPTCPRSMYDIQLSAMEDYLAVLESRAELEGVKLLYED